MRLIDADALIEKCGDWYVEEGSAEGFIGSVKQLVLSQPIVHESCKDADLVSRQAVKDIFTELYGISAIGYVFDKYDWADICETTANELPSAQPEPYQGGKQE